MAGSDQIATVYATALFEACQAAGTINGVAAELMELVTVWDQSPELRVFMENPSIEKEDKLQVVDRGFAALEEPLLKNFLGVLVKKGRFGHLTTVASTFKKLVDEANGVEMAEVVSAVALPDDTRQLLTAQLSKRFGKKIELAETIDPDLLGGFTARVGDTVIDGSVKRKLDKLAVAMNAAKTSDTIWEE